MNETELIEAFDFTTPVSGEKKSSLDKLLDLGYTIEVHEDGKDHFVRRVEKDLPRNNPYMIPVVNFLKIEKIDENKTRAVYVVNNRVNFAMDLNCGYNRAKRMAMNAVTMWHHISHKG